MRPWLLALAMACGERAPPPPTPAAPPPAPAVALVWKEGRRAPADAPILVVLHGMGDRPEGILPLVVDYPHPVQAWAPQAPTALGPGYTWFSGSAAMRDPAAFCDELRASAATLAADLAALDLGRGGRRVAVTGFSQGGMLTLMLALHHPAQLDLALPLSGYLPTPCRPEGGPPPGAPPIRAFHGEDDDRLPIDAMRSAVSALQAQGWDASLRTYPGLGHSVNRPLQADLFSAMAAQLHPAP